MNTSEIAALLRPYVELESTSLVSTETYLNLILKWNARVNLTSVRGPEEMVRRHFGESFFVAAQLLDRQDSLKAVDLGSGAGFPGLPMAIFAPQVQVTLIEANGKKAAFLNEVIRALGLKNARVFAGRAEVFGETADLVTMRAVEKFEGALPMATKLVKPGGRLALMIGAGQVASARETDGGISWHEPVAVPGGHSRVLLVGDFRIG